MPRIFNIFLQIQDDSGGSQSPSKSPLRHATFLPSLQSVDEKVDEEEEMDDEATEMGVQPIGGGDAEVSINGRKKTRDSSDDQMMPFWVIAHFFICQGNRRTALAKCQHSYRAIAYNTVVLDTKFYIIGKKCYL
jgi:hypothetical protein